MDTLVKILMAFILSVFFARGILSIVDDIARIVRRRRSLTAERRAGRERLYDLAQGTEDDLDRRISLREKLTRGHS